MGEAAPSPDSNHQPRLQDFDFAFVISDARQPDNPVCFASQGFYRLTGFCSSEVLGRNCRFMQGRETELRKVMELRDAIREERACQTCLLNYKKDGQKFWNQLCIEPVLNDSGMVTHYVGLQTDVSEVLEKARADAVIEDVDTIQDVQAVGREEKRRSTEVSLRVREELSDDHWPSHHGPCSILPSSLLQPLAKIQQSFVLVDASQEDMPIVHAGEGFLKLTGYPREKVIGHNCRFLQGPETDPKEVNKIRAAVTADPPQSVTATLLNYRYDGTPFWNYVHIKPIRGADGKVVYLAGVQLDITQRSTSRTSGKLQTITDDSSVDAVINKTEEGEVGKIEGSGVEAVVPGSVSQKHKMAHSTAMGKVRMVARSLSGGDRGLRRAEGYCELPKRNSVDYLSSRAGRTQPIIYVQ